MPPACGTRKASFVLKVPEVPRNDLTGRESLCQVLKLCGALICITFYLHFCICLCIGTRFWDFPGRTMSWVKARKQILHKST